MIFVNTLSLTVVSLFSEYRLIRRMLFSKVSLTNPDIRQVLKVSSHGEKGGERTLTIIKARAGVSVRIYFANMVMDV